MTRHQARSTMRRWQDRLGLGRWRVEVLFKEDSEAGEENQVTIMSVSRSDYYEDAVLHIHPACVGEGPFPESVEKELIEAMGGDAFDRYLERKIIHELGHLLLRDIVEVAFGGMEERIGRDTFKIFEQAFKRAEESTVDDLAQALLTAWPTK